MKQPNHITTAWTESRVARLREYWAAGLSCSQIANEFACGFTRNSIIGKAHRLWLAKRSDEMRVSVKSESRSKRKPVVSRGSSHRSVAKPQAPRHTGKSQVTERRVEILSITPASPVGFFTLREGHCRFAVGEWDGVPIERKLFCGAPQQKGSSFCADHHLVCWEPARPAAARKAA